MELTPQMLDQFYDRLRREPGEHGYARHVVPGSLRLLDPTDPVKYDFALCHWGMSGACPVVPVRENCLACPLGPVCVHGHPPGRREG